MKMKIRTRAGRCARLSRQIGAASLVLGMAMSTVAIARDGGNGGRGASVPGFTTLVLGGTLAGPNDNPFTVAIVLANEPDDAMAYFCEGVQYTPTVVITSAFCMDGRDPKGLRVLTGTRRLDGSGTRREIAEVKLHPKWNLDLGADYDIAIIRLKSPVPNARLASLASVDPAVGTPLLSTGWGRTTLDGSSGVALTKARIPVVSRANCNDANSYNGEITQRMFCAGYDFQNIGPCLEIGSPLAQGTTLFGINSVQGFCPEPNKVPVFTRISNPEIRNFILNND